VPRDAVERYSRDYSPTIYTDQTLSVRLDDIGPIVQVLQWEPGTVKVRSADKVGWLPFVALQESYRDLMDVAAALTSALQTDWPGAAGAADRILMPERRTKIPQSLLIDMLLFRGFIEEKAGRSGSKYFKSAEELNELRSTSARYVVMGEIAEIQRRASAGQNNSEINERSDNLRAYLARDRLLFSNDDDWYVAVTNALKTFGSAAVIAERVRPFTLSSMTFKDGTLMPKKVANKNPANSNCVGDNVSPQLSWSGAPEGTKSFALTMVDAEGRGGLGVFHWVAYGIPANVTSFAEGEASMVTDKYVGGKSSEGMSNYSGPCTPPGSPHHYTFMVISTDLDPKALPPGLTLPELQGKLNGHVKGAAGLVGLFVKPE
jgi:Raf kinase inhibitor-like YbhB/YbcL family protein